MKNVRRHEHAEAETHRDYDAVLIVAFGGPEGPDDVMPFLENVTRGRRIPKERLLGVAKHYDRFGGVSPLNEQVRQFIEALRNELGDHKVDLPVYWGNRNWHPLLPDTLQQMANDGVRRAVAFVMAAYGSYSSCRQYLEDIEAARSAVGPSAPRVDKIRLFFNHPEFIAANTERLHEALEQVAVERRDDARIVFTAHSLPKAMADTCDYADQIHETCRLVCETLAIPTEQWDLVYQSRSGRPSDPWLEPDILDHMRALRADGIEQIVIAPIGFLSDHMEVVYDLDVEARQLGDEIGLSLVRAATVGTHPRFVRMVRELIEERITVTSERRAIGRFAASPDICPPDCCSPR